MESYLTLHTVVDNGLVLEVGEDWSMCVQDSYDLRLPRKRQYCGEDQSRHVWDNRGMMSTEPPTPVLVEPQEYADDGGRYLDSVPMYTEKKCVGDFVPPARPLRLPDGATSGGLKCTKSDASPASSTAARIRWSEDDDRFLVLLVSELGHNWPLLATRMEGRTSKQVKERWTNQLDPSISTEPWQAEDDQQLVELIRELGHSWCEIARRMPGRTESMVKNRFHANLRKRFGNHIFDPSVPLPLLSFKPKSLKSKKTVISEELRAAAADAAEKAALISQRRSRMLPPLSSYFASDEESILSSPQ